MKEKWVGFGRDPGEMNIGPWSLTRVDTGYDRQTRQGGTSRHLSRNEVGLGQLAVRLDVAERDIAPDTQQAAHTSPARFVPLQAAGMVVIDADPLALFEGLAAHPAPVVLGGQHPVERLRGQAIAGKPVRRAPPLSGHRVVGAV